MIRNQKIGTLPINSIKNIPEEFRERHEFIFLIHDKLVALLLEYETSGVHRIFYEAIQSAIDDHDGDFSDEKLQEIYHSEELKPHYEKALLDNTVLALASDMLHFVYEALKCFEKRKCVTGFSLLRKPIKEHLFYLSFICARPEEFIKKFQGKVYSELELKNFTKDEQIEIFAEAASKTGIPSAFDANFIHEIIYDRNKEYGLEHIFQKSTHIVTCYGKLLKTETKTLNGIFEVSEPYAFYEKLYRTMPYIIFFSMAVIFQCFHKISPMNENTRSYTFLTTMVLFNHLMEKDALNSELVQSLNTDLEDFMNCIHCDHKFKIEDGNLFDIFTTERFECGNCNLVSDFPLYWIFAKAKLLFVEDKDDSRQTE